METEHTELMRKESIRLLSQQVALLNRMMDTKGLLQSESQSQKQSMDKVRVRNDIDVMEGELSKLKDLDMVLAVVGTMKSGKSTTNNAIVGLEVLPNRNRPMTALPTLIRHAPEQQIPILLFKHSEPINQLIRDLDDKLNTAEGAQLLSRADQQDDLQKLVSQIQSGYQIQKEYRNEEGIFELLKGLNDLVRLSTAIQVEFPFEEYRGINELPVIEVEFQHLRGQANSGGRLSLLDTPGPNEEGQFALKPMMQEQLRRASGVIAVLDYTQLKSESDADVRRELLDIAEVAKGRLSVLVNKFDQKDRHSDGVEAVKSLVAKELLKGEISESDVYPISSKYAYLANRARTELAINGSLPDYETTPWVKDFAEEGLGRRWERDIDDSDKVADAIHDLWDDSLFHAPLEHVIQKAHDRAAIMAIDSAAAKLVENGQRVNNFIGLRETALKKNAEELQENIKGLEKQKTRIDELEKTTEKSVTALTKQIRSGLKQSTKKAENELTNSLDTYFKEGRARAAEEEQNKLRSKSDSKQNKPGFFGFMESVFSNIGHLQRAKGQDFDPGSPVIEFDNKQTAQELLDKIADATRQEYELVNQAMLTMIDSVKADLDDQSKRLEKEAMQILSDVSRGMKNDGFEIRLNLPTIKPLCISMGSQDILENMVSKETRTVTRSRRQKNLWGSFCSLFGTDDWGWEDYEVSEKYYSIDLNKIRKKTLSASKHLFTNVEQSVETDVIQPVEQSCKEFFSILSVSVDEIRGDLLQGLADSKRSREEQEDLAKRLADLKLESSDAEHDIHTLKTDSSANNHIGCSERVGKLEVAEECEA